jgi:hypothetical protein
MVLALAAAACAAPQGSGPATSGASPSAPPTLTPAPLPTATLPAEPPTATPAPPGRDGDRPAFTWHREGGIAGYCDDLTVFPDGSYVADSCKFERPAVPGELSAEDAAQVDQWLAAFHPFLYDVSDAATADSMTVRLDFAGQGQGEASADDIQAMLNLAARVYAGAWG